MGKPNAASIEELEGQLDQMFHNQVRDRGFVRSLNAALGEWSRAIVAAADALGPSMPSDSEIARGLELARSPVFVCGPARAGTTLLRDLLDGHPELAVIPVETGFYGMARPLMQLREDLHRTYLTRTWLQRLAYAPPFWLLPPAESGSPYVGFARDFAGWWQLPDHHRAARQRSWPLLTFALSYAQQLGGGRLPAGARMWVEKTPSHVHCLDRIWQDLPAAKVIQIVRGPQAVLASYKAAAMRMPPHRVSRRRTARHVLAQMAPAYRIAAHSGNLQAEGRYHLVRYEDLVADRRAAMGRIAAFLEIEPLPSLLQPTVGGRPAIRNSSFEASGPDVGEVLESFDRSLLAVALGRYAAKLGYA